MENPFLQLIKETEKGQTQGGPMHRRKGRACYRN